MKWFNGNMLQAIAEAHSRRALLLVFVEGDDMASRNMRSTFEDAEVNKLIEVMGCVPIRLRVNSSACRQFALVYPVTAIPSTFFISSRGNLEASIVGFTDPVSFSDRLAKLMASCTLRKVDSDMRNASETSVSADRMARANRQSSSARPPDAALAAEGVAGRRSRDGERRTKKKHRRQEANVQTSIVVLAEQSTQINMDDKRSYNSLLQKLAAMEEATLVPPATVATAQIHGDLAGDLVSLMGDTNEKKDPGITPEELNGNPLARIAGAATGGESVDVEKKHKPAASNHDKREMAGVAEKAKRSSNEQPRRGSRKKSRKGKDEITATMPPQPPPPPPPSPGAEAVRATEVEHPTTVAASDALLEFADKVLGSSQYEQTDWKSLEASAAETTTISVDVRRLAEPAQKQKSKKEQRATKSKASPLAKNVAVHAKGERQRQHADAYKGSRQLENMPGNLGDAAGAIAALEEAAFEQAGDKDTRAKKRRASSGARSQKQPRNSDAQRSGSPDQQAKQGSEKRKKRRESPTKDNAGDSNKVAATLKKVAAKAAAVPGSTTRKQDAGLGQLAEEIEHFESAASRASQDAKATLAEKKGKRSKSASPPKPPANDTSTKSTEHGSPRTYVQMPSPPPIPTASQEQTVSVVRMRPGIDTITEEEIGAIDSCLTSPQPTPPPPQSPLPAGARTRPKIQKTTREALHKSSGKKPACEAATTPLSLPQAAPPQQQTTRATVAQNRNPPQSRKSARRPSSPTKSKEFLTASNSQLEEALVFGPTHRTSDDSAAATTKRAPPSCLRPRGQRAMAARSPLYERLVKSDGDDETVDEELTARRTPSATAFRGEADWMDEMARTASRRTLLYRAGVFEESLNNLCRTLNDVEVPTVSLSMGAQSRTNIAKVQAAAAQERGSPVATTPAAPPASSPSRQHGHVTINDKKADGVDDGKASAAQATASTKATHRVSLSGTNVRNRARSRRSPSRPGGSGGSRSPSAELSQAPGGGNARKSASFTPTVVSGRAGGGADDANIVFNLPNGSSVQKSFPASAYLDEVRWYTEELLASTLPSCFPFTMARTNPLREFSREDYRKTLEQLRLAPSATLLVLPRSAAQGESGAPALLPSGVNGEPVWVAISRRVFGMLVTAPLSLVWKLLNCPTNRAAREALLSSSLGSSTLPTLAPSVAAAVATPARSVSSGRLCRRGASSHTENFDVFRTLYES
ncbi:mucin-4-like isoform X2 [Dermacentor albipictus]|uniref:mucin-4-like isoform X2 n=1 Tax=Dermacentor albipictus TaxID=60249 RepID=UPI0031FC925F